MITNAGLWKIDTNDPRGSICPQTVRCKSSGAQGSPLYPSLPWGSGPGSDTTAPVARKHDDLGRPGSS